MPTLAEYALGLLLVAHGWVHFVYVASSRGWFGSGEGWGWNGRSWLLSGALDDQVILDVASVFFVLAALGFVAGAVAYVLAWNWWEPALAGAAILSTLLYVVLWDGQFTHLAEKGAVGVLVDAAIVGWAVVPG